MQKCNSAFYWWKDFLIISPNYSKRFISEFPEFDNSSKYMPKIGIRKIDRPKKEILEKLILEKPVTHIAKDFGVSDQAVAKWIKYYEIDNKPGRGYWQKMKNNPLLSSSG